MKKNRLAAVPDAPLPPGRILDACAVAALLCLANPASRETQRWVSEHVPHKKKLGHRTVRWLERDVLAWVEASEAPGGQRASA